MKKRTLYISFLAITGLLAITSCKNDLDVLAPSEEAVSVYGIISPNEPVQNIRINKVYITDGDVLAAGQDASKINYGPGELEVYLERFLNGKQMSVNSLTIPISSTSTTQDTRITLTETVIATSSGVFNQEQRIWQTTKKILNTGEYKLTIKNLTTGKEFTAQNAIIDSVKANLAMPFKYLEHPNPSFAYPNHGGYITNGVPGTVTPDDRYIDYTNFNIYQRIKFKSVLNAKLYKVNMRFHYREYYTNGDSAFKYVDMSFPVVKSPGLAGSDVLEITFPTLDFYSNIAADINSKNVSNLSFRRVNYMEYSVYAGAESLDDFLQINAPSNSIAQDKPNYTNIKGGVGIFSSKSKTVVTKDLLSSFVNKIACHPLTHSLRFKNFNGNIEPTACN